MSEDYGRVRELERQASEHYQTALRLWAEADRIKGEWSRQMQAKLAEMTER
jgi:hypothetical protein